jgi:hypothetical protein
MDINTLHQAVISKHALHQLHSVDVLQPCASKSWIVKKGQTSMPPIYCTHLQLCASKCGGQECPDK